MQLVDQGISPLPLIDLYIVGFQADISKTKIFNVYELPASEPKVVFCVFEKNM